MGHYTTIPSQPTSKSTEWRVIDVKVKHCETPKSNNTNVGTLLGSIVPITALTIA